MEDMTYSNVLDWAQRVGKLCELYGGDSVFEGIETAVKALKAERDDLRQRLDTRSADLQTAQARVKKSELEHKQLQETVWNLRSQNYDDYARMDKEKAQIEQSRANWEFSCHAWEASDKEWKAERDTLRARVKELEVQRDNLRTQTNQATRCIEGMATERQELQARVKELKAERAAQDDELRRVYAERAALTENVKELEAAYEGKCKALSLWVAECKALREQHTTSAPAGRMEVEWSVYDNTHDATMAAQILATHHWSVAGWQIRDDGTIAVMWQRPVASGQVSEGSED